MRRRRQLRAAALALGLTVVPALVAPTTASASPTPTSTSSAATVTHYEGALADGSTWIADVPTNWHKGTLILYSHGYHPTIAPGNPPADAPDPDTAAALLARGYALVGSSYKASGWAMGSAVSDQFGALAAIQRKIGHASRTIAFGTSMGGLVSAREAEQGSGRIDGALTTCGLVAGGLDLNNYQLDAEYAIRQLLLGGHQLRLVRFRSMDDALHTASVLAKAAERAQKTTEGRARLALAMAMLNTPTWYPGETQPAPLNYAAQERQQFQWLPGQLTFIEIGRYDIEQAAGGNAAWNIGVDYRRVFNQTADKNEVQWLYSQTRLDLRDDLDGLTAYADISANQQAYRSLRDTSAPTGNLVVPELDLHTTADQLVPVEQENAYAETVRRAGHSALLRQAYVHRQSHCNFTPAELVAGVEALQHRLNTGSWDNVTTPWHLNRLAAATGLGESAFIRFTPHQLAGVTADNG